MTFIVQDWRNFENVNQNNMRNSNNSIANIANSYFQKRTAICSSNANFSITSLFLIKYGLSTTIAFAWKGINATFRFTDQAINTYPGLSGFSDTIQQVFAEYSSNSDVTIKLTPGVGNNYVVAQLSFTASDAYNALPSATILANTTTSTPANDKIVLFALAVNALGFLYPIIDNNCAINYVASVGGHLYPNLIDDVITNTISVNGSGGLMVTKGDTHLTGSVVIGGANTANNLAMVLGHNTITTITINGSPALVQQTFNVSNEYTVLINGQALVNVLSGGGVELIPCAAFNRSIITIGNKVSIIGDSLTSGFIRANPGSNNLYIDVTSPVDGPHIIGFTILFTAI